MRRAQLHPDERRELEESERAAKEHEEAKVKAMARMGGAFAAGRGGGQLFGGRGGRGGRGGGRGRG
jgi:hypothetical protein